MMGKANGSLVDIVKFVLGAEPVVIATAGKDTDIVSLRNSEHLCCFVNVGALGSASYLRVTPFQGASLSTCATAYTPQWVWLSGVLGTSDTWTKTAWGAEIYHDLDAANTAMIIEVDASSLTDGQWSFKLNLDSDNNTGPTASATLIGTNLRFAPAETMIA